ncbi:MAG TPA: hypothetical protein VIK91_20695, partial [Nannocystis sp.]
MPRAAVALATIVALALAAAPVRAQGPVPPAEYDTVVLRDGTVLRGTIRELRPGHEVVIEVGEETRTIAWPEVESTALAGALGGSAGSVPKDSDELPPGPSRPRIFIELTRPAEVHLLEAAIPPAAMVGRANRSVYAATARSVCRAPCGRVIDGSAGYPFYFGGPRLVPSRALFLRDLEGDYVARVRPGRLGLLMGGVVTTSLGYAGTLTGGNLLGISRDLEVRAAGGAVLGAGLALLLAGITMAVHGVTRYTL